VNEVICPAAEKKKIVAGQANFSYSNNDFAAAVLKLEPPPVK
jgi:hypothetical protein